MLSRGIAQLESLSSHLTGRTLALRLHDFPGKRALQTKRTPRAVGWQLLRPELEQTPIRHDGHRPRALDAVSLVGDLLLPQAHDPFEFFRTKAPPTTCANTPRQPPAR